MPYSLKWSERVLFLTLGVALILKFFHPVLGVPLAFSSFLFKASTLLFFFLYVLWPWCTVPPEKKQDRWTRGLHFLAPSLWAWIFLWIFLARNWIPLLEAGHVELIYSIPRSLLFLFVMAWSIHRINLADSGSGTRYYGWIIGRTFLIGMLGHFVIGTIAPGI